ncbi:MAG: DNA topoisomerase (ATP-hydrolyzing) subunit A [Chlamydiia bacterium]|nr:DNA topoisomerase (ATP-hydrolyzing) subunit A [Chlamydiia bacterium]
MFSSEENKSENYDSLNTENPVAEIKEIFSENQESFIEEDISTHVQESFLKYSLAVIASRAFPDARDGLKPSHRRILYVLRCLGLSPGGKFRKSAKICGDTSGDFHPHGESVVYPTMVRLAQDWSMRYRLIDGQGNFGSIDGDPPGAMRYTEGRMTKFAAYLMEDLEKDTVDMVPNYDETRKEPVVMPAKFNNLLCNGTSGIAVGMSTYIPPHNLGEVIDATILLMDNPNATMEEIMEALPAPDFPTGGIICGLENIKDLYKRGRGKVILQSKVHEEEGKTHKMLIITEIPFGVNKSRLIERIAECVETKQISEIADIRDESGRDGMRICIMLKRDITVEVALNKLYKLTPVRTTLACHMLALDKGAPKVMNIRELLEVWIDHREVVITRRTAFELNKAKERLYVLEGFMKVLTDVDASIAIIKESGNREEAHNRLREYFGISEKQANSVLDMKLYKITALEITKIASDYDHIKSQADHFSKVLESREMVIDVIRNDLLEIKEENKKDCRKTRIEKDWEDIESIESLIPNNESIVMLSREGFLKRFGTESVRSQKRGGQGILGANDKRADPVHCMTYAKMHDYLLIFTASGKCYWIKCWQIPELSRRAQGQSVAALVDGFDEKGKVTAILRMENLDIDGCLVFCTKNGIVKKTTIRNFSSPRKGGVIAINLDEGDYVINVQIVNEVNKIIIATNKGAIIKFDQSELSEIGRSTRGVRGIRMKEKDFVVSCRSVIDEDLLVFVSDKGYGKRTVSNKVRETKRGGVGVKGMKCTEKTGNLVSVLILSDMDNIMLSTQKGKIIKITGKDVKVSGRVAQGVKLISLQVGDKIIESESIMNIEDCDIASENRV